MSNSTGTSEVATVSITINPINDLPIIDSITDIVFDEDGSSSVTLSYSDSDSDVSVSANSLSDALSVSLEDDVLTIISDSDYYGFSSVTVSVSDQEATVSTSFNVTRLNIAKWKIQLYIRPSSL